MGEVWSIQGVVVFLFKSIQKNIWVGFYPFYNHWMKGRGNLKTELPDIWVRRIWGGHIVAGEQASCATLTFRICFPYF